MFEIEEERPYEAGLEQRKINLFFIRKKKQFNQIHLFSHLMQIHTYSHLSELNVASKKFSSYLKGKKKRNILIFKVNQSPE